MGLLARQAACRSYILRRSVNFKSAFGSRGGYMKLSDRRLAQRFSVIIPLYIRTWNSQGPEQIVESVNLSECGAYYETDTPPREGAMMHIRLDMPKEVTGNPTVEWRCTGKVMRVSPVVLSAALGVSVRFDYYEVSKDPLPNLVS
jgi:hypothetical protein